MSTVVNRYRCDDCGWEYDPASYAGVDLTDQDSSWVCPNCQATIDHFQLIVPADDDLTDADEAEEDSGVSVNPAEERPILARSSNPTIDSMKGRYDKGRLIPQPDFQRYQVWPRNKQSRLIESILLDLPLPLIYLAEEPDGRTVVIDGQQRLMAIFDYLDNKYPLKGLGPTKNTLDKSYFRDLDESLQGKIEDFELSVVEIKRESDAEIRFELFERLNTGATSLNDQELRNCVYRGDYNDFIKDLATDATFRKLLGLKDAHARMADVELVLRFMAFRDQTYLKYPEKKTKGFLNKQMELGRSTKPRDQQKAAKDFKQATQLALTVFGDRAFKKYTSGTSQNPNGSWARANNRALMDVQLWTFTQYGRGEVTRNADAIRERAIEVMAANAEFADVITFNTSDRKRLEKRFKIWKDALDEVIGSGGSDGRRLFDRSTKEELLSTSAECAICGQLIRDIDDAQVDHVIAWAEGGKTELDNAQLAHRYCNQAKGAS